MSKKTGWVEKRQYERIMATLRVEYQIVSGPETQKLLSHENYRQTTVDHLPELSEKSSLYRAVTKDISLGGLSLVSQQPFEAGTVLEVSLHLPNFSNILKFLAEIRHVETTMEMGKVLYHAGLKTLAIHKGDVNNIAQYLIEQQKTGGASSK